MSSGTAFGNCQFLRDASQSTPNLGDRFAVNFTSTRSVCFSRISIRSRALPPSAFCCSQRERKGVSTSVTSKPSGIIKEKTSVAPCQMRYDTVACKRSYPWVTSDTSTLCDEIERLFWTCRLFSVNASVTSRPGKIKSNWVSSDPSS